MNRFMYSILLLAVVLIMSGCESSGSGSDAPPSPYNSPPGPGEVQFKLKWTTTGDGKDYEHTINLPEDLESYLADEDKDIHHDLRVCLPNFSEIRKQKGSISLSVYNPYDVELKYSYYSDTLGGLHDRESLPGLQYTPNENYLKEESNSDGYYYDEYITVHIYHIYDPDIRPSNEVVMTFNTLDDCE